MHLDLDSGSSSIVFHSSWPEAAKTLVLRAIDRHGGWSLWSRLQSVTICLVSLAGALPWCKGYQRSFTMPRALTVFPKRGRTEWWQAPGKGCVGVFDRGDMRLLDPATGDLRAESPQHRRTFHGLTKLRRWSEIDALFFFGYAFASYSVMPFALPRLRFMKLVHGRWQGESLAGVAVEFEPGAQVHSRRQSYFFDATGLLKRNDYVADVVGPFATGAHGWDDYALVDGLPIPARRTVVHRLGRVLTGLPPVLAAEFDGFTAKFDRS